MKRISKHTLSGNRKIPGRLHNVARLKLTDLENRITPTLTIDFSYQNGLLSIASDANDAIVLGANDNGLVLLNGSIVMAELQELRARAVADININGGPGSNLIDVSGVTPAHYVGMHFKYDLIAVRTSLLDDQRNVVVLGGAGDDTITGSPFADSIDGGTGADSIDGGRNDDLIGWDFQDSSVNGGSGDDLAFLSLEGMSPTQPSVTIASQVGTGNKTFVIDGVVKTVSSLESIEIEGGDFGAATGSVSISLMGATTEPMSWTFLGSQPTGPLPASTISRKLPEIVVVGSGKGGHVEESISFNFEKYQLKYNVVGGPGNDTFAITPGNNGINIDGGGGVDPLTVNHLGLAVTQAAGLVQIAGRAAVNHVNFESVSTGRTVFGPAAEAELKAGGVTASAVWTTVGFFDVATVTIKNQSALPLTNIAIEIGGENANKSRIEMWSWHEAVRLGAILRVRSTGGLVALVDPNPQGTPFVDILGGEPAYDPRISISAAMIPAGGQATLTIETAHNSSKPVARYHLTDAWPMKMGWGASQYQYRFSGSSSSVSDPDRPVIAASLTPSGKTSVTAGSSLAGVSADGATILQLSSATDYDPYVTSISAGTHVYVNNVMVDTNPIGTASGNGSSSQPVISATGRWVAFTTNASDLIATGGADMNGVSDVAVRNLCTGKLTVISRATTGLTGNGKSFAPQISADGRYVFFLSEATNLVGSVSDTNGAADLFRFDTSTSQLVCISVTPAGTATGNRGVDQSSATGAFSISGAGDSVSWFTEATDIEVGGSLTGMHLAHKKGSNNVDFIWFPSVATQSGARVTGDGERIVFWTDANLSTLTGVPDTNGVSDLFVWDPVGGKVSALSINNLKTNMGDGPTPGNSTDAVALSYDGSTLVVTSDADNLIPGLTTPTEDGLYRYKFLVIIDRTDTTSTGYGGNNHFPTISPDGQVIAWSSTTNYGTGTTTYSQAQNWVRRTGEATENVSGNYGLSPNFATRRPLLADNGHTVFFESQSPMSLIDANTFFDVYSSVGHESLVFNLGSGSPSIDVETKTLERRYVLLNDSATKVNLVSRPLDTTRWLFLYGADADNNAITVDYGTGLAGLSRIFFDGGLGIDVTHQVNVGDGQVMVEDFLPPFPVRRLFTPALQLTLGSVEQLSNKLFVGGLTWVANGSHKATIDPISGGGDTKMSISGGSGYQFDTFFDTLSELTYLGQNGASLGGSSITFNGFGTSAKSPLPVLLVIADGQFNQIDASKANVDVMIVSGGTNDTIKGGFGWDRIGTMGAGNTAIFGGPGDDTIMLNNYLGSSSITVNDSSGRDTLDFSGAGFGIDINLAMTGPQMLTSLGHVLSLNGSFENVIGSEFDDEVLVAFIAGVIDVDGGPSVNGGAGDKLVFDAAGQPAANLDGQIFSNNKLAVEYADVETVQLTDNAPPPQVAAIIINDGAVQRSMVTSIVVAFNGPVSFVGSPAAAFQLTGPNGSVVLSAAPQNFNGQTSVRLTFIAAPNIAGSLADGLYALRVLNSQVVGGLVGGDLVSLPGAIYRLFGDANGDRTVNGVDFAGFRGVFGLSGPSIFDFNGDNLANASDFGQFRARFGLTLTP